MRKSRYILKTIIDQDLYWLAGILEGEGCFCIVKNGRKRWPLIKISMTDEDVIRRVSIMWDRALTPKKTMEKNRKQMYLTQICGSCAVELMTLIKPLMGIRRSKKIEEILTEYNAGIA